MRRPSLLSQILALNVLLVTASIFLASMAAGLDLTISDQRNQFLVLALAILLTLVVNMWLLRRRFEPLERLLDTMEQIDLSRPGRGAGRPRARAGPSRPCQNAHRAGPGGAGPATGRGARDLSRCAGGIDKRRAPFRRKSHRRQPWDPGLARRPGGKRQRQGVRVRGRSKGPWPLGHARAGAARGRDARDRLASGQGNNGAAGGADGIDPRDDIVQLQTEHGAVRILIADDHGVVRSGLKLLLDRQSDIEVVAEAEDGVDALEKAVAEKPDVVILDVSMPRMTGLQ